MITRLSRLLPDVTARGTIRACAAILVAVVALMAVAALAWPEPLAHPVLIAGLALARIGIVIAGMLALGRVLRQRQQALDQMRALKNQAEAANQAKSSFLATMSHEIRTPMNAVLGMAELLNGTTLDTRQQRYVEVILRSGRALLSVIDDVLDFSRIEAGRLSLDVAPFEPAALVLDVANDFREAAAEKGLVLQAVIDPQLPSTLLGDSGRIRQVLSNLIGNAVKFTLQGNVAVEVSATARGNVGEHELGRRVTLKVAVIDTGIGVSPEVAERLFQPFSQGDGTVNRSYGGSGLGLAICRKLAHSMGGSVDMDSQPGHGSTFTFEVPLSRPMESMEPELPSRALGAGLHRDALEGVQVLLAEDNPMNQVVAGEILQQLGCSYETAVNGFEVLAAIENGRFDVVLMDCMMPVMDGYETTRRIRDQERGSHGRRLPIIALTASATTEDPLRCAESGMDDYLAKPYTVAALEEKIRRWVSADARVQWPEGLSVQRSGASPQHG